MKTVPMGWPIPAIANTPLVSVKEMVRLDEDSETRDDGLTSKGAMFLNTFILNCQLAVEARHVERRRMLKDALHEHVRTVFGERLDGLVDAATDELYSRLVEAPDPDPTDDEFEADTPDGLDLPPMDDE